ncbi:MAG TPA: hypothetical protein VIP70_01810 [Nitrososphaeraceae archaeon]|jgi:hypothetical protein
MVALTLSLGLSFFASMSMLQTTTIAQVELPPTTNVTILNETAIDDKISNSTDNTTTAAGMVGSTTKS